MNRETKNNCQHCGKPLGTKVIQGLCPACLLKVGLGSVEGDATQPSHFDAPPPEDLVDLFPQLEIQEQIGAGGMGAVYRAHQRDLDQSVALKILAPRGKDDPSFAERFMREARALARLSHPHIVTVHDIGHAGDHSTFLHSPLSAGTLSPDEQAKTHLFHCANIRSARCFTHIAVYTEHTKVGFWSDNKRDC